MKSNDAARLKRALSSHGLGCAEFARLIGTSRQNVSNWTRGAAVPKETHARKIADVLGIKVFASGGRGRLPGVEVLRLPADAAPRVLKALHCVPWGWPDMRWAALISALGYTPDAEADAWGLGAEHQRGLIDRRRAVVEIRLDAVLIAVEVHAQDVGALLRLIA